MSKKSNKAARDDRREAARAKAEQLRKEQAAKERRTRNILFGVLGLAVIGAIVAVVIIINQANKPLLDAFEGETPANTTDTGGVIIGESGVAGEAIDGAPTLEIYLDFMCPYCGQLEAANAEELAELRDAGELNVEYHVQANLDLYSLGTLYSTRTANAAATVVNAAPEAYVDFMMALFENQPAENTEGLTDEQIAQFAVEAGVPQEVADTFVDGTYNEWVEVATEEGRRTVGDGTPALVFEGELVDPSAEELNYYEPGELSAWLAEQGVGGE